MDFLAYHKDMENLKQDVQTKFSEIRNALHMREKLLLRQAEVIVQQTKQQQLGRVSSSPSSESREVKFLAELEDELLMAIRNFGRFQLDNINLTLQDVYLRNEDYITPTNDHETMYKCLLQSKVGGIPDNEGNEVELENIDDEEEEQPEAIVVDFSRNKSLIEHNTKHMNKSIINITLQEAKELIKKAKLKRETPIPPLNLEELADELESSIAEAVSSLGHDANYTRSSNEDKNSKSSKKPASSNRFKPKITINNCNGTINLRNISNLTINCATEDSISAEIPFQAQPSESAETPQEISQSVASTEFTSQMSHNQKNDTNRSKSTGSGITNTTQKSATIIEAIVSSTDDSPTPTTTASSSNYSSSSSSRSQSKKQKSNTNKKGPMSFPYDIMDYDERNNIETHAVTCDFYNRLLKEIKNSLRLKRTNESTHCTNPTHHGQQNVENLEASGSKSANVPDDSSNMSFVPPASLSTTNTASQPGAGRRLVLKNYENLRIVLEANSSDDESFHPVQIEQWLAEIISETDLEPMQNTDILEHSKIHSETN